MGEIILNAICCLLYTYSAQSIALLSHWGCHCVRGVKIIGISSLQTTVCPLLSKGLPKYFPVSSAECQSRPMDAAELHNFLYISVSIPISILSIYCPICMLNVQHIPILPISFASLHPYNEHC